MVSRPRSTRASSTTRLPTSYSNNWDNPRNGPSHDRRSLSNMRYQSSTRDASAGRVRPRGEVSRPSPSRPVMASNIIHSNSNHSNRNGRQQQQQPQQRAISAGKIRPQYNYQQRQNEDPTAVAKKLLDLRERRESGGGAGHGVGALGELRPNNSSSYSIPSSKASSKPTSPKGRMITTNMSNMSEEEIQAEQRLKRAESKISGLLDELEELKFFQELEHAPTTPRTPKTPSMSVTGTGSGSQQSRQRFSVGGGGAPPPLTPSASRGSQQGGGIPITIRATSPARGSKLPPPPPVQQPPHHRPQNSSSSGGGLETYRPLSPRRISKLDRNSLELECQTLVRKLQLFEQERNSQAAMIEMYEISMQEHDMDKVKIEKLESELMKVSSELKRQLHSIQKGKESLVKDYEEKLQANLKKLHRVQEICDSFKLDAETAKSDAEKWKQDLEMNRCRAKEEKTRADNATSREAVLELQLKEARNLNATLVKKIEKKRSEVSFLKEDLTQTNKILAENKENRDEAYEARITALQAQLTDAEGRYAKLEEESTKQKAAIQQKDVELESARVKDTEQSESIRDYQEKVEELERQCVAKYEEGKKAGKSNENKKMTELIGERAKESREYERRIKAMQEQLKHQSDRHHAEIQETRKRNDDKLAEMREEVKEEVRIQEGDKAAKLNSELSTLRRNYEEAKIDNQARLKEAQSKVREAAAEFKHQDEVRQQELDHMHERLQNYVKETGEKDTKLTELTESLEQARSKLIEETETMLTKHQAEIMERDQKFEEAKEKFEDKEADLQDKITAMKATHVEIDKRLRGEVEDLRTQVDEAHKQLVEAQAAAKDHESVKRKLLEIETELTSTQEVLNAERNRHEDLESELRVEVAKLEGKLRSSESNLKISRSRIVELETQLDTATATSSKFGEEKQAEIKSLRARLDETQSMFDSERKTLQEKEAASTELNLEISSLQQKMKMLAILEEQVQDEKRRNASLEYEKTQKEAELTHATKSYEETRAKLLEAEQRYTNQKAESESNATKRERLVERYEKNIQDLEFRLENERNAKVAIESSISDLRKKMDSLETDKIRKETELVNLRKDYEDLSALLEENLHNSARKEDADLQLKRKEREMKETVDIYNQQISDLESKLSSESDTKSDLHIKVRDLQKQLGSTENERARLSAEISELRISLDNASSELQSQGGVQAELSRKDRQIREAVQRYTKKIAELESKLEEETQEKLELDDRLSSARSELEDKQKQTQELIQKQTKAVMKLESDLRNASFEKEQLKSELDQTTKDLEQKRRELNQTVSKYSNEASEFRSVKQEHTEFKEMSNATKTELERKEKQMTELKKKIPELLAELDSKSRECQEHKEASRRYENELSKRKEQLNDAVARYTDKIARLESKLDEHTVARSTTEDRVETVKAEASRKDHKLKELNQRVAELEAKLETSAKNSEAARQKVDDITRELDDKEADFRSLEMEKIELETKLHTQKQTQKEMRSKVSDMSSRLERKEREVREVTDRYKMYIMELESKLDQDTDAKHRMQVEIDKLKTNLNTAAGASNEAAGMREQINALEDSVDEFRSKLRESESKAKKTATSLEERLTTATKEKEEIETMLNKSNSEKAEVIAALEGVINEVQNREDEIESLSELLHRRDEELEHAKIIATKALQSAKDIQKRYRDKEKDRESEAFGTIDELHDNINDLTSKNDTLQHKISSLERDLKNKNLECTRLRDQLKQFDENQLRDNNMNIRTHADDESAFSSARQGMKEGTLGFPSTHSSPSYRRSFSNGSKLSSSDPGGFRMDPDLPARPSGSVDGGQLEVFAGDSFSPSPSPRRSPSSFVDEDMYEKEAFDPFHKEDEGPDDVPSSGDLSDGGDSSTIATSENGKSWGRDRDNDNDNASTTSSEARTRKSIERDALRRYVRQRYRKRG